MKKTIFTLLILFLTMSIVSAEDNTTTESVQAMDNITEKETGIMVTSLGAKIRLLELEHRVKVHILTGEDVITLAKTKNFTTNDLEAILEETKELLATIQSTSPTADDTKIKEFVDLKHDAVQLVKDFREKARLLLTPQDLATVKKDNREELKALRDELKSRKQEYNAERLKVILEKVEESDDTTIEKVRKGEIKVLEVKTLAKAKLEKAKTEKKIEKVESLRKELEEKKQLSEKKVLEAKENFTERRIERVEGRAKKVESKVGPTVKEIVQARAKEKVAQKIDTTKEKSLERKESSQEKKIEARNNAKAPEPKTGGIRAVQSR